MIKFRLLILMFLTSIVSVLGDGLEKGFEKMRIYDYFQAKKYFEKALKKQVAGASYGLSVLYSKNNSPFYNLDSARAYILISDSAFYGSSARLLTIYKELGISAGSISAQRDSVCLKAFLAIENSPSVLIFNDHLQKYDFCQQKDLVIKLRNAAAFQDAGRINTAAAFEKFMKDYPGSKEWNDAKGLYDEKNYEEITATGSLSGYRKYLAEFPDGPYRKQAEKKVYQLSTPNKTLQELENFIRQNPNSSMKDIAWKELNKTFMTDFNDSTYQEFRKRFPEYPFMDELDQDFRLMNSQLLPFRKSGMYGFINEDGKEVIKPAFEECFRFSEGLASVKKNGKYGYINKSGKLVIPCIYDETEAFGDNMAVVSMNEKYGLINKKGEVLIPFEYEDLSNPSEEICIGLKEDQALYLSLAGKRINDIDYDYAHEFHDGYAIAGIEDQFGILRKNGSYSLPLGYKQILESGIKLLYRAKKEDKWGLISPAGIVVVPFSYQLISEFYEGKALVVKNGKCGFINETGKVIVPISFNYQEAMLNSAKYTGGYVLIKQKNRSLLFDSLGQKVSIPGAEDIGLPSEGLIPVKKNKKWGYSQLNGKIKIECKFQQTESFESGYARIKVKSKVGLIDTTGSIILAPIFDDVEVKSNCLLIREHGLYGLQAKSGMMLLPREFDKISFLTDKIAEAQKGELITYVNIITGKVILRNN